MRGTERERHTERERLRERETHTQKEIERKIERQKEKRRGKVGRFSSLVCCELTENAGWHMPSPCDRV